MGFKPDQELKKFLAEDLGKGDITSKLLERKQITAKIVKVYEKIQPGIWSYNGFFDLIDAWQEDDENRKVFKFKLSLRDQQDISKGDYQDLDHNRLIPSSVKLEVFKRDQGKCIKCGSGDNLHYDHILPFSKGGTSITSENIQILCARHNIQKSNRIE